MKKIIYKYPLSSEDAPELLTLGANQPFKMKMSRGAEILDVQAQKCMSSQRIPHVVGKIWALCDPAEKEMEERTFRLIQTGSVLDCVNVKYIGTYQLYGGDTILHLFEQF